MNIDWTMQFSDMLKVIGMITGAVYVVARVEFTTAKLTLAIEHLTRAVDRIDGKVEHGANEVSRIKERLAILDSKLN